MFFGKGVKPVLWDGLLFGKKYCFRFLDVNAVVEKLSRFGTVYLLVDVVPVEDYVEVNLREGVVRQMSIPKRSFMNAVGRFGVSDSERSLFGGVDFVNALLVVERLSAQKIVLHRLEFENMKSEEDEKVEPVPYKEPDKESNGL